MNYSELGVTQKMISKFTKTSSPHVSRWFSKNKIEPMKREKENAKNYRYSIYDVRRIIHETLFDASYSFKDKIISFYNFKGGTGKTSICYQVSSHLALMGFNVLVIDADPQGHLSTSFGFNNDHNYPTLSDVISGIVDLEKSIHPIYPGLSCLPSNLALTRLEVILNELPKREERLRILVEDSHLKEKYDFIIFDTNPTISLLNRNILTASDFVCIVCETQPYSLNGLKILMEDMIKFYSHMGLTFPDFLVIPNKYEDRSSNCAEAMTILRNHYSKHMIPDFAIRRSEDIINSSKLSLPLPFFCRSNSIAFEDIVDLTHGILQKLRKSNQSLSEVA